MSELFNKQSHLNRYKINHGLRVSPTGNVPCDYLAERKLKKIFRDRITDQTYADFKKTKNYTPPYLTTFDRFMDRLLQRVERDGRVGDTLKFFYNHGLMATIERYLNKRENNKKLRTGKS